MDYIFYRLYRMYEKHGDPPRLSAVIHLCYSLGISLIIAFFAIKEWYDMQHKYAWFLEGLYSLCFLLVPLCLLIIYCCIRYRKKKILEFKKKYQGCTRNKLISNWMIFCIPIYIAIIGILIFRKLLIEGSRYGHTGYGALWQGDLPRGADPFQKYAFPSFREIAERQRS